LKSIDLCGEIGFDGSWTRRKKKNALENHLFCDPKANGTADFAERRKENEEARSEQCQFPGSCAKDAVGERR